ncbi:cysteine hydrolase family protein [Desulfocurvibacter africanus]|uniref:cysteine hydrolase family protein n=1 Tax=Desulfocurvibacter africanus TaxID=873 RepID=UPI002FD9E792
MDATTALLLIDIQLDYFPGGRMELVEPQVAAAKASRLLTAFRQAKRPVFHVRHISTRPGAAFFLPDTDGVAFHPAVEPLPDEAVITKHFPNSFRETLLLEFLRHSNVSSLLISGMMTHMCVHAAARAAADLGFACSVASDACATRDMAFGGITVPAAHVHTAFLGALHGTYAHVADCDTLLAMF